MRASTLILTMAMHAQDIPLAYLAKDVRAHVEMAGSLGKAKGFGVKRSPLSKILRVVAGPGRDSAGPRTPFLLACGAGGEIVVTDRGRSIVHRYEAGRVTVIGSGKQRLKTAIGVDTDAQGNVYLADSESGRIAVYTGRGRFVKYLGEVHGEGIFKRATGLSVDRVTGEVFVTDTLRHEVIVLSHDGRIARRWGKRGVGSGEFNFPTAVAVTADFVFVLDTMNFRVQRFTRTGVWINAFGKPANEPGGLYRPKAIAIDARRELLLVTDAYFDVVQAFRFNGELAYAFGENGMGPGQFRFPAGICISQEAEVLVADTENGRIQIFRVRDGDAREEGR